MRIKNLKHKCLKATYKNNVSLSFLSKAPNYSNSSWAAVKDAIVKGIFSSCDSLFFYIVMYIKVKCLLQYYFIIKKEQLIFISLWPSGMEFESFLENELNNKIAIRLNTDHAASITITAPSSFSTGEKKKIVKYGIQWITANNILHNTRKH